MRHSLCCLRPKSKQPPFYVEKSYLVNNQCFQTMIKGYLIYFFNKYQIALLMNNRKFHYITSCFFILFSFLIFNLPSNRTVLRFLKNRITLTLLFSLRNKFSLSCNVPFLFYGFIVMLFSPFVNYYLKIFILNINIRNFQTFFEFQCVVSTHV